MSYYYLPKMMIICLIITILVELSIAIILKIKSKKDIQNIILVNILTNPIVVTIPFYFNIYHGLIYRNISLFLLEIVAILVEGIIYKKYLTNKKINPFLLSLILNVSSYTVGLLLNYL